MLSTTRNLQLFLCNIWISRESTLIDTAQPEVVISIHLVQRCVCSMLGECRLRTKILASNEKEECK